MLLERFTNGFPLAASCLSPQFDLLPVRSREDNPTPAFLPRFACGSIVRRADQLNALFQQILHRFVEMVGFKAKMKSRHGAIGSVRQLQDGVAKFEIGDLHAPGASVLKILLKTKMLFVKGHGAIEIADVKRYVVNAFKHDFVPDSDVIIG